MVRQQEVGVVSARVLAQGSRNPCGFLSDASTGGISGSNEGTLGGPWMRAGHRMTKP